MINLKPRIIVVDTLLDVTKCGVFSLYINFFDIQSLCDTLLDVLKLNGDDFAIQLHCFEKDILGIFCEIYGDEKINTHKPTPEMEHAIKSVEDIKTILTSIHSQLQDFYNPDDNALPHDFLWINGPREVGIIQFSTFPHPAQMAFRRSVCDRYKHYLEKAKLMP